MSAWGAKPQLEALLAGRLVAILNVAAVSAER